MRFNVSCQGIPIDYIKCGICDTGAEPSSHLFFSCCMVRQTVRLISQWWDISYVEFESYEDWFAWLVNLRLSSKNKLMLEGVFYVMWWYLWSFHNKMIFETKIPAKAVFSDDIVSTRDAEGSDETMHLVLETLQAVVKAAIEGTQLPVAYRDLEDLTTVSHWYDRKGVSCPLVPRKQKPRCVTLLFKLVHPIRKNVDEWDLKFKDMLQTCSSLDIYLDLGEASSAASCVASKEKLIKNAGVSSWFSELGHANNLFVSDVRLVWTAIDCLPMCAWNKEAIAKIVSPWGALAAVDTVDDDSLPYIIVCVTTKVSTIINDRIKIIVKGKIYWIRIKELEAWSPEFDDEFCDTSSVEESVGEEKNSHILEEELDHVSESSFMKENNDAKLNKKKVTKEASQEDDPSNPPGFTPNDDDAKGEEEAGGSIMDVIENLVEFRQTMGYNIEGCKKNLEDIVASHGDSQSFSWVLSNEELVKERTSLLKELYNINKCHSLDMAQKAKVRWAIEGDENSKLFHGIINKKRSQLAIRGVLIKDCRLECDVTYDEIKRAVWDCGTNKSPGLNGFTFDFISTFWQIINQDVVNAVREFFIASKFPPGCNSSFIALIPKKQDAKFVKDFRPISLIHCFYKIIAKILANHLNMVISDLISDVQSAFVPNRQILNDFEKAFDSVRWDYLDDILSLFKGIRIDDTLTLSHLCYADDAIFIGKWERANVIAIVLMLNCFFMASGLQINIYNSKLMGIGVSIEEVNAAAIIIGCSTFSTPFTYLGFKVGMSSSRKKSWDEVIGMEISFPMFISLNCIIRELDSLSSKRINLLALLKKKVGNGAHTFFWEDTWINDTPLSRTFPRLAPRGGAEEDQFIQLVDFVDSITISNSNDRWVCLLESLARLLWSIVARWWDFDIPDFSAYEE
uniref:RNA-directed DNA polymerase, eukaryota n=1 Tax=Tanacetum cinerariifolium TaxID=118510 RepID=A0A6L2N4F3_TANCI|nr:RNA-directed DNA polymerase, eukaryota [Tanacetum cinerariifolium]